MCSKTVFMFVKTYNSFIHSVLDISDMTLSKGKIIFEDLNTLLNQNGGRSNRSKIDLSKIYNQSCRAYFTHACCYILFLSQSTHSGIR